MIRLLALLLCLHAGPVLAGAWPREAGTAFVSLSHWQASSGGDSYTALFAEWGLTPRLTLGFDAGRSVSGETKTVLFLRAPVMDWLGVKVAAEIGYGEIAGQSVIRPGLSFGRALEGRYGAGWLAVDTVLEYEIATQDIDVKADITLGFTPQPAAGDASRWTLMVQVQTGLVAVNEGVTLLRETGQRPDPSFLRIVPSVTYQLREGIDLELGVYQSLTGTEERGVKLGVWSRF
ncbi:MAG: hypothetical protein ACK4NW_13610 [Roseinatronobacter sp.]